VHCQKGQSMLQQNVRAGSIKPGANPRRFFDPALMAEMEASVKEKGVIQPIALRNGDNGDLILVAGERRLRAAIKVHGEDYQIPAVIRDQTEAEAMEMALIENIQRASMNPAEEAEAASLILGRCSGDRDEAAKRLGWSRSTLDKRLALMNCSEIVRNALVEGKITLGHAELLAAVTKSKQDDVLAKLFGLPQLPPVAQLRTMLEGIARSLATACFDKEECTGCAHNSANQRALFSEAIADGNCTNGECHSTKTEAAINAKAASLKDEWATVKIVRPGEDKTIIRLVGEGSLGVGEAQAVACKACTNYGVAISAVPGKECVVYPGYCMDVACNTKKVAGRLKAEKAEAEAVKAKPAAKAGAAAKTKPAGAAAKQVSVQDSQRIKDYRETVWREVLRAELEADPQKSLVALVALAATGNLRTISASTVVAKFGEASGTPLGNSLDMGVVLAQIGNADKSIKQQLLFALAPAVGKEFSLRHVTQSLDWIGADLATHWKLNADYLDLLTKTEIEAVATELGVMAALGNKAQKLLSGKKPDLIKALLEVEGFTYDGLVPANMKWTAGESDSATG
jgi:ParB family chromosome partitioning protein